MKKITCLTLLSITLHLSLIAQTKHPETDALLDSARTYIYSDNIKSYAFTVALKQKAQQLNNGIALSYASQLFGIIDESHGDTEAAFKNYTEALRYAESSSDNLVRLRVLMALSNFYINTSQTDKAIETCQRGIKEALAIGKTDIESQFYNNLSMAHSYIHQYEQALQYADKSIELKKILTDEESLANAYLNKGLILSNQGNYPEAFKYYALAEDIYLRYQTFHALTQTHINFAWDYTDLKQFNEAKNHLSKALLYSEKSGDVIRQAGVWNAFGYYYNKAGIKDSVTHALQKGLELSMQSGNKRNALTAHQELSNHYQNIGNNALALENLQKAYALKDSIFNESKIQLAQSLNARYENERKEHQISLLTAQKEKQRLIIMIIILAVVLLCTIATLFFIRYQKQLKRKKEQELQKQKEAERIRIARDMHDEIGAGLTRIVMWSEQAKSMTSDNLTNNINDTLNKMSDQSREISHNIGEIIWALNPKNDSLDKLLAYVRNYAFDYLEDLPISCKINIPEQIPNTFISPELRRNIFLIIKESLNNIVKHADASNIEINITLFSNKLSIHIQDNGKGIDITNAPLGNGLDNMKKRAEDIGATYAIVSGNGTQGTCISIEQIPI